jgi:hypothetical protein
MAIGSFACLFGFWLILDSNNSFGYEGWYFVLYAVALSAVLWIPAFNYYVWPRPKVNIKVKRICAIPHIAMLAFSLVLIVNIYW